MNMTVTRMKSWRNAMLVLWSGRGADVFWVVVFSVGRKQFLLGDEKERKQL
jgi:hypothetical protein